MMYLTEAQAQKTANIRRILDEMIEGYGLTDEAAFNANAAKINRNADAFRVYKPDKDYVRGDVVVNPADDIPYWAMHNHGPSTGQVHEPSMKSTIWTQCHGTTPGTAREFIAEGHNPYMAGHYCRENGVIALCNTDYTVHPPSVLPQAWTFVPAE